MTRKKQSEKPADTEELTIEEAFAQLDQLAERMEGEEVSLEESFSLYSKGLELLALCGEKLDMVEKKMQQLDENGELSDF